MTLHGHTRYDALAPRSRFYQGPFGRLFPDLPPWEPPVSSPADLDAYFLGVANSLMTERPGQEPSDLTDAASIEQLETQFSSDIPAGYTYFGQFIDHDITFDPVSSLMRKNDPNAIDNFRTPRFDLDNIYGSGPADQPYLYDKSDGDKLEIGQVEGTNFPDLPRYKGTALIGDKRNDENAMVSQLQLAFLLAHNALVDRAREAGIPKQHCFEAAQKSLRWLYQFIVWNDFVKRITDPSVHTKALTKEKTCDDRISWKCCYDGLFRWKNQPYMPVEFSVAAYRFGHSMVRNAYQTNNPIRGFGNFAPIFDHSGPADPDDLRGFRPMTDKNCIQWDWFLDINSRGPFPQMARKIDTKLANALTRLHEDPNHPGDKLNVLAFLNLKRGWSFGLPSGTAIANKLAIPAIALKPDEPDALWYYILKEAELAGGNHLGHLGSIIVCAVFAGLLKGDPNAWINLHPAWTPDDDPLLKGAKHNDEWSLAAIIVLSGLDPQGIGLKPETMTV